MRSSPSGPTASTLIVRACCGPRVDLLIDIRARRGMRGRRTHSNAAAPSRWPGRDPVCHARTRPSAAAWHSTADAAAKIAAGGCASRFIQAIPPGPRGPRSREFLRVANARRPVLFCVEREPEACHRSLVARLGAVLRVPSRTSAHSRARRGHARVAPVRRPGDDRRSPASPSSPA